MEWVIEKSEKNKVPILSWCKNVESGAMDQAYNLSNHPKIEHPVVLMPDTHQGYGMPIGGVIAVTNAVIPNAVGVDCGCGMVAVQTEMSIYKITKEQLEKILIIIKKKIPVGFSIHLKTQEWENFNVYTSEKKGGWFTDDIWDRAKKSLGTLGGGNHFAEVQKGDDGYIWLMVHSGSRNLGKTIADYYYKKAKELNEKYCSPLIDKNLSFLPINTEEAQDYLRDMNFALEFAYENRTRMIEVFVEAFKKITGSDAQDVFNIHHNYATIEHHYGKNLWIHRKGATSAKAGETGIIPGSMGTPSYIVEGLGNSKSYNSCSHGAGRKMSRTKASNELTKEECNEAMKGIVFGSWGKVGRGKLKGSPDLSESPLAYKDIDEVMESQKDCVKIKVKLTPIANMKG